MDGKGIGVLVGMRSLWYPWHPSLGYASSLTPGLNLPPLKPITRFQPSSSSSRPTPPFTNPQGAIALSSSHCWFTAHFPFATYNFHQRLVFWNSIHQEVASDSFCFLINSSWLLVFILYVFSLFFSGFNLYCWKGIHFS